MTALPLMYCKSYNIDLWPQFYRETKNLKKQIVAGVILGVISMTVLLSGYFLYVDLFGIQNILHAHVPLQFNWNYLYVFFAMFAGINPILEELFWRMFVGNITANNEKGKLVLAVHYGLYHFFVVDYIMRDAALALMMTVIITILGRALHFLKDRFGLIAAIVAHIGVDAGVCVLIYEVAPYFMR